MKLTWSILEAATLVIGMTVGLGLIMAVVWGALDWMRYFPAPVPVLPDFLHTKSRYVPPAASASAPLESLAVAVMNWYNLTFIGATRFGSGLGMLAGAIWALAVVGSTRARYPAAARAVAGLLGGAFIGGRLALMLGSFPRTLLWGTICGALIGAAMLAAGARESIPELPEADADY
jgi:hypothetical protein